MTIIWLKCKHFEMATQEASIVSKKLWNYEVQQVLCCIANSVI